MFIKKSLLVFALSGLFYFTPSSYAKKTVPNPHSKSNWQQIGSTLPGTTMINAMTADQTGNLYVGSGFGQGTNTPGYVYKYTDGARGWMQLGKSPDTKVGAVAVDANGNVFAGTGIGFGGYVYQFAASSGDWRILGGRNPSTCPGTPAFCPVESLSVGPNGEIYAAMPGGNGWIFKIAQGSGQTWQPVTGNGQSPAGPVWAMTLDSKNNLYIGTSNGYAYVSKNGNTDWQQLGGGQIPPNPTQYRYITSIAVDQNGNVYAGSILGNVYMSTGGTGAWQQVGGAIDPINKPRVNSLMFDRRGNLYAATGDTSVGHVYKLSNSQWEDLGASPDGRPCGAIAIDRTKNTLYVSTYGANVYKISQ